MWIPASDCRQSWCWDYSQHLVITERQAIQRFIQGSETLAIHTTIPALIIRLFHSFLFQR